jgi:hypothetical protein
MGSSLAGRSALIAGSSQGLGRAIAEEFLRQGARGEDFYRKALEQKARGGAPLVKGATLAAFLASRANDGITGRLISAVWDRWEELVRHRSELEGFDSFTLRRIVPSDRGKSWP